MRTVLWCGLLVLTITPGLLGCPLRGRSVVGLEGTSTPERVDPDVDLDGVLTVGAALQLGFHQPLRMVATLLDHAHPCPPCPPLAACEACQPEMELYGDPPGTQGETGIAWVEGALFPLDPPRADLQAVPIGASVLLEGHWVPVNEPATDRAFRVEALTILSVP
jgi:hypothetical protein